MSDLDYLPARDGGYPQRPPTAAEQEVFAQTRNALYPREMVPDLSDAALAMRETVERDKAKAKARKARREFASDLLWKAVNGLGVLVLLAIVGFVALWLTLRPAAAGEPYYRYACGTYVDCRGTRVLSPARTIPSTSPIHNLPTQHWSSIYAPGYSHMSLARPIEHKATVPAAPGVGAPGRSLHPGFRILRRIRFQ